MIGIGKNTVKILAISGSAREVSTNTALLLGMKKLAPAGVDLSVVHNLNDLPVFSPDMEGQKTPAVVREFMKAVFRADGIIISSPEYVRSIPGGLKNAIDWMVSRFEIIGKPIALVHASHRGDDMLSSLRLVLSTVSSNFQEELFLRIPLMGKSPNEVAELLAVPEHQSKVRTFMLNFLAVHKSITSAPNLVLNPDGYQHAGS